MFDMKRYLRTVVKKSSTKFEHVINIPAKIVKELGLSGNIVELKIKDGSVVMKKIGETLDGVDSFDENEENGVTIHY